MTIAIIGAGMAGLTCATRLVANGKTVTVFDKGRGPGGRMATRRAEADGKTLRFDHGAQFFTATDERFAQQVAQWETAGVIAHWSAAGARAFVGVPAMNAPIKAMAAELDVHFGAQIEQFGRSGEGWRLDGENVLDTIFDTVLVAVPAEQSGPLLRAHTPDMADLADRTPSEPCWTVMVAFDDAVGHGDIMRDAGAIGWAARNSFKPGRSGDECWVIQASPAWSRNHLECEPDAIIQLLLAAFREEIGGSLPTASYSAAHRWLFARSGSAGEGALWDGELRVGACGDWLLGPNIEDAYISGLQLAEKVLASG